MTIDDSGSVSVAEPLPSAVSWLVGVLGGGYLLLALALNEFTLGWIFGEATTLSSDARLALGALDAILLALAVVSLVGRRSVGIVLTNMVIVAVVVPIVSVEFVLRHVEVSPSDVLIARAELRRPDDYLHHALSANVESFSEWGREIVRYSTNNLGFRDLRVRDVAKTRSDGERMLILGDSFSEGLGVEYEDGFPHQLQELLSADGANIEVLTGGVSSYSPRFEYRQLVQFIAGGYTTNVVVLMLDITDVHDEGSVYLDWTGYSEAERQSSWLEQQRKIELALQLESELGNLLYPRLLGRIRKEDSSPPLYESSPRLRWTEQEDTRARLWVDFGIKVCSVFVRRIEQLCRKEGVHFYLGIYPHPTQLSGDHCIDSEYRQIYRDFARRHEIELIDLFSTFCELESWPEFFIEGDVHWNARGHQLVASRLFERLRASLR